MVSKSKSIGAKIGERLGLGIVRGRYSSGELLPTEFELARLYGVGRSTIRDAVKLLSAKGLVATRRREGTRVLEHEYWNLLDADILRWLQDAEYSHQLLFELVQTRLAIEPEACAIVAHRRARVDFSVMDRSVALMDKDGLTEEEVLNADLEFHLSILDGTANRFFIQMKPLVATTLRFGYELIDLFKLLGPDKQDNSDKHRELFEAMIDGKPEEARRMARDMSHAIEITLRPHIDT